MLDSYEKIYRLKQVRDIKTHIVLREVYYNAVGNKDRGGLPSLVDYDPKTGKVIRASYYENGIKHRVDGPASYEIDPATDVVISEYWNIDGKLHREDGLPAIVHRHPGTGEVNYSAYYRNGYKTQSAIKGIANNNREP